MASAEALRQPQTRQRESRSRVRFLDQYRASEKTAPGITAIDFEKYKEKGVTTLLLDAEGTFVRHDGWQVDQDVIDKIKNAGFEHIAIVSNKKPKDERTFVKLNYWAHQIGADIIVTPESKSERKPHPAMLEKALVAFHVRPDQALMVGDKRTADIKAANAAGTHSVHVERHGEQDLAGDRYLRRPLERGIGWKLKREKRRSEKESQATVEQGTDAQIILFPRQEDAPQPHLPTWTESIDPALLAKSKIVNLGGQVITLPQKEQVIPKGKIAQSKEEYKAFMRENGRTVANTLSWSRLGLTLLEVGLDLANKPRAARVANGLATLTDGEGVFARMDKDGPSKEGGELDHRIDKASSALRSLSQYKTGRARTIRHAALRIASDAIMSAIRPNYNARGIDTKASIGKIPTVAVGAAENVAYSESNPEWVQNTADVLKVARVPAYILIWEKKDRKQKREQEIFTKAKAELLAA